MGAPLPLLGKCLYTGFQVYADMNSKGQGLSMNTIILAALGLIVLVVLVAVFTGETGDVRVSLGQATDNAQCVSHCQLSTQFTTGKFIPEDQKCETTLGDKWTDGGLLGNEQEVCCCLTK